MDRACKLSYSQRHKLQLAGRGDMKAFFEQVEIVRQKFLAVRKDQEKFNQIWNDIQPLQTSFQSGLFGDESLFHKTLRNILDDQQRSHYAKIESERRAFHYRARVELTVATLEGNLPLRDAQRQKLIEIILSNTTPPRRFGPQDTTVVMWRVSQIPEGKLRPLFDDAEWKIMSQQLLQARGLEQWLRTSNLLDNEDDAE